MKDQIQTNKTSNGESRLPDLDAFKKSISTKGLSHGMQHSKSFHFLQKKSFRTATVERFGRSYKVVFEKSGNEVLVYSVDGNHNLHTTYSDEFLEAMEIGALESTIIDSTESYNDTFNGD
jgi:hypothetical protein